MRKQATSQGVAIDLEIDDDLPTLMVDAQQIRQAVLNLVINGLQALPHGGRVKVGVSRRAERVCVLVEDNGPGLDEQTLKRVFEPFFTTKEGGTGLGLSIAFQIADQHGGDLRGESRATGGARFCLELPIENRAPAPTRERTPDEVGA